MPSSAATTNKSPSASLLAILRHRPFLFLAAALSCSFILLLWQWDASSLSLPHPPSSFQSRPRKGAFDGTWKYRRDRNNLLLDEDQCNVAFPGLFDEVDRPVHDRRRNKITVEELDAIEPMNGYIRGMIYDGEIYVIAVQGAIYSRGLATLHALHRAVITSPDPLPNIEFVFNVDDRISPSPQWAYARRPEDTQIWLMPDFGYWSWPETHVGSYTEVQRKAEAMEDQQGYRWAKKTPKLLWRGASMNLKLREKFVNATRDKPWADVKTIQWHNEESMAQDLKSMDEHCQYKYLAHTEGNSYSGRLKYLQNCNSVIVAHELGWIQHHHPLMSPSGENQNYVAVDRDFEKLDQMMKYLSQHDSEAERIADNNVQTFRERYLTPAAEACYWRALIRGWKSVQAFEPKFVNETTGAWRGLPVESFLLERRLEWDPY